MPLLAPCSPHPPRPTPSTCPSCVSACSAVVFFPVFALSAAPARPAFAPCSSPCYPCPAALRPLTRLSPLPFSFSLSTLPVGLPSLSEPRCHSCVPPACSTPAPPHRPYPFPCGLPHPSARSVPVSHPILVALCPVCVCGGGVSADWTVALPKDWHGRWFFPRTMSHRMCRKNTERTSGRRMSNFLRCICTVEPSRVDQLRTGAPIRTRDHQGFTLRCTSQVSHGAGSRRGLAWSTRQSRARVSPMVSMQQILSCRELCRHVTSRRIARTLLLPVHRGATETWLHCTGLEYTCTATCPSQQSL